MVSFLDISLIAVGPDNDIYCNICCHKISWPSQYAGASDCSVIPGDDGEPNNCPRCGGKVNEYIITNFLNTFSKRHYHYTETFLCNSY